MHFDFCWTNQIDLGQATKAHVPGMSSLLADVAVFIRATDIRPTIAVKPRVDVRTVLVPIVIGTLGEPVLEVRLGMRIETRVPLVFLVCYFTCN